jgi:LPS-assembly lipoprotein
MLWLSSQRSEVRGQGIEFLRTIAYCLIPIAFLSACTFQPVYGTSSAISANAPLMAGVKISATDGGSVASSANLTTTIPTKVSRDFKENLEDLLNPITRGKGAEYSLDVSISQSTSSIGISRDGTASRYNLNIYSSYKLTRLSDNKLIDTGTISNTTSYNNPSNQYFSTYISEQDARKRGVLELAALYRQRLSVLTENSTPPAPKEINPITPPNANNPYEAFPKIN